MTDVRCCIDLHRVPFAPLSAIVPTASQNIRAVPFFPTDPTPLGLQDGLRIEKGDSSPWFPCVIAGPDTLNPATHALCAQNSIMGCKINEVLGLADHIPTSQAFASDRFPTSTRDPF